MRQNILYKNCDRSEKERINALVEHLLVPVKKQLAHFPADTISLRGMVEKHPSRRLYRVALLLHLPRRLLSAQEEGHDAEETLREAFTEIERQLQKYKEFLRNDHLWRRPARRAQIRQEVKAVVPEEERKRELYLALIQQHLKKLYNFVRREITYFQATGDLRPGELSPQEVVDAVVIRGYQEFLHCPPTLAADRWLLKLALEYLTAEIKRLKFEHKRILHLEGKPLRDEPDEVATLDDDIYEFYQPDEKLRLEDLVPDAGVPTPEQVAEDRDLQRYINQTLALLPRAWRNVFVLHHVEDLSIPEVAHLTGLSEDEVQRHLEHAREFLHQKILETDLEVGPEGMESAPTFFGTAADVDVSDSLRRRVEEQIRDKI